MERGKGKGDRRRLGPFKCYVTQMGVGGVSDFLEKSVTKV